MGLKQRKLKLHTELTYEELRSWAQSTPLGIPPLYPVDRDPDPSHAVDYHRMQLEYLIWAHQEQILAPAIDIGAEWERPYLPHVTTMNHQAYFAPHGPVDPQLLGSITHLPFATGSLSSLLCTEVLEHVPNLFRAVSEIKRVLSPSGLALLSTPWFWPDHGNSHFGDYWRLTPSAYAFLFADFASVDIYPTVFRPESLAALHQVAALEVMDQNDARPTFFTGFLVVARKKGES